MSASLDIAAKLTDSNEYCGRCGRKLQMLTRVGGEWVSSCTNKGCDWCSCIDTSKVGVAKADSFGGVEGCLVHWKCDCRDGALCLFHRSRPDLVVNRCAKRSENWAQSSGFCQLEEEAKKWLVVYRARRSEALSHCGSCWAKLEDITSASGEVCSLCPKGCECLCSSGSCPVHFTCGCLKVELCKFHRGKRPEIAVALYRSLPPNDPALLVLSNGFAKARIDLEEQERKLSERGIILDRFDLTAPLPTERVIRRLERKAALKASGQIKARPAIVHDLQRFDLAREIERTLPKYKQWLVKQKLSAASQRNYQSRLVAFARFLGASKKYYQPLSNATKDLPVRDLVEKLRSDQLKAATINSYLSAIESYYSFLGLSGVRVGRAELKEEAPQCLKVSEQRRFLKAIEKTSRAKDRAIALLLFYSGLKLVECARLEIDDLVLSGRRPRIVVRGASGTADREVPITGELVDALNEWLAERDEKYAGRRVTSTVFLNPQGKAMLPNSLYEVVRKVGRACALEISPHTLRHTYLANLFAKEKDAELLARVAGHRSVNTTKKYLRK